MVQNKRWTSFLGVVRARSSSISLFPSQKDDKEKNETSEALILDSAEREGIHFNGKGWKSIEERVRGFIAITEGKVY